MNNFQYYILSLLIVFAEIHSQTTTSTAAPAITSTETTSPTTTPTTTKCFRAQVETKDTFKVEFFGNNPIIPDSLSVKISQHHYTDERTFEREIIFEAESINQCTDSRLIIPVVQNKGVGEAMIQIKIQNLGLSSEIEIFEAILLYGLTSHDVKLHGIRGVGAIEATFTSAEKAYVPLGCKLYTCPSSLQKLSANKKLCLSFDYNGHRHTLIIKDFLKKKNVYKHYDILIQTMHPRRNAIFDVISIYATARVCDSDEKQPSIKINVGRDIDKITIMIIDEIEKRDLEAIYRRVGGRFVFMSRSSDIEFENIDFKSATPGQAIRQPDAIQVYSTRNIIDTCGTKHNNIIITQRLGGRVVIEKTGVYQDNSEASKKVVKIRKASEEEIETCLSSKKQN